VTLELRLVPRAEKDKPKYPATKEQILKFLWRVHHIELPPESVKVDTVDSYGEHIIPVEVPGSGGAVSFKLVLAPMVKEKD